MTRRLNENLFKVFLFIVLLTVLLLQSIFSQAQTYKGLDARFGSRLFTLRSNMDHLNQATILQNGGRFGVIYGNRTIRANAGAGYYSSASQTPGTIDQYEGSAQVNFYPLTLLLNAPPRLQPYITGSITLNTYKFYGYYINRERGNINYSQPEAPYFGSIRQVNTGIGAGLEFSIVENDDFVKLYSEIFYGKNLSASSTDVAFSQTAIDNQIYVSIGLSFGLRR